MNAILRVHPVFFGLAINPYCTLPRLIGNSTLCDIGDTSTFNLQDIPQNSDVFWSVSDNTISIASSNSTSVTIESQSNSGEGTIIADINGYILERTISIGAPPFINNQQIIGSSGNEPVNSSTQLNLTNPNLSAQMYRWWIVNLNTSCQDQNGFYPPGTELPRFQTGPNTYSTEFYTTQSYSRVYWGNCRGNYVVNVAAVNSCGERGLDYQTVNVYDPYGGDPCPDALTASPNPSSNGTVTVQRLPADPCGDIPTLPKGSNTKINSNETNNYNRNGDISNLVEIFDLNGLTIFSQTFDSNDFEINGLQGYVGTYILKLTPIDGQILTKTLLLE